MSDKPNHIPLVKTEKISYIGDKPKPIKPKLSDMPEKKVVPAEAVNKKQHIKQQLGLFQKFVLWLVKKKKGEIIAALVVAVRQIIYPFDVYKVNASGEWILDESRNPQVVPWASYVAKIGSLVTFALAYLFNDPIKDFTGKGVIEWLLLLLN
jgi:hypothetical protein